MDVRGIFKQDIDTSAENQVYTVFSRQGAEKVRIGLTNNDNLFINATDSDESNHFVINSSGNIAIGSSIPINKLDVIGNSYISGNLGLGITNSTSKLVVNGTIGIDASSSTAGRTRLSSSIFGFTLNHNHDSPITFQTQSVERLRIGAAGTITASGSNSGTEIRGTHLRLTNSGGGDTVISWDNTNNNANQRWYAGIDVSDNNAWKLAKPTTANFDNEDFDRPTSGGDLAETKLKIDTSGNASLLGGLTLNTDKFIVAGTTGNTTIAGTLNVGAGLSVTVSGSDKFSVDTSGNVSNAGTITSSGKIKGDTLESDNSATVGTTLEVGGNITAQSFTVKDASNESLLLRATGIAKAITKPELDSAVGFSIQPPVVNSNLPNGNSIQLQSLTFDGNGSSGNRIFALKTLDDTAFTPISAENLLVSVGGIIQRPNTDYTVSGSNITFPDPAWTNPPAAGLSCFIIAFGGLGGLTQNQDWDTTDKGVLLVGSGTDNLGIKLGVGGDGSILTPDSTTLSGLKWSNTIKSLVVQGTIQAEGDITAYYNTPSDQRLKDNITPIPDALNKVLSISGNTFDWNEKTNKSGQDVGVIAQEILEVLPEAVTARDDGYLAVYYDKIVPLLIEAIKEQQGTISNLQNRLEILEGK